MGSENGNFNPQGYEEYIKLFDALSHPMRVKIIGILAQERQYVSELARIVNISRPLLYMHLKKLEVAGIILGHHEISQSGKAIKYFELKQFNIYLTPELLTELSKTIPNPENNEISLFETINIPNVRIGEEEQKSEKEI